MSTAGERIIKSAKQALAFAEGKNDQGCVVHIPEDIDVKRIRRKTGLSQRRFAETYGFKLRTLQEWEQGRAAPSGASRNFLVVLDKEPEAVERAFAKLAAE